MTTFSQSSPSNTRSIQGLQSPRSRRKLTESAPMLHRTPSDECDARAVACPCPTVSAAQSRFAPRENRPSTNARARDGSKRTRVSTTIERLPCAHAARSRAKHAGCRRRGKRRPISASQRHAVAIPRFRMTTPAPNSRSTVKAIMPHSDTVGMAVQSTFRQSSSGWHVPPAASQSTSVSC